jgi:hypothetical protein
MRRMVTRLVMVSVLVGLGWAVGRAQTSRPAFELIIDAPAGETTVTCKRGCELSWVERGVNRNAAARSTFSYKCGGAEIKRCSSATIGGWVTGAA